MADSREFPGIPEREFPVALVKRMDLILMILILILGTIKGIKECCERHIYVCLWLSILMSTSTIERWCPIFWKTEYRYPVFESRIECAAERAHCRDAVWVGWELGQQRKAKMASENGSEESVAESASKLCWSERLSVWLRCYNCLNIYLWQLRCHIQ